MSSSNSATNWYKYNNLRVLGIQEHL
jgi:hypothetical protein